MRTPRYLICVGLRQFRLILLRVLVNLENCQTRIKLMFAYLKHPDCLDLSLHPLKNFEYMSSVTLTRLHKSTGSPEPSLITFVISTSPSSCSDPVIKKKDTEVLHVAHRRVCVLLIQKSPGGNNAKISCGFW